MLAALPLCLHLSFLEPVQADLKSPIKTHKFYCNGELGLPSALIESVKGIVTPTAPTRFCRAARVDCWLAATLLNKYIRQQARAKCKESKTRDEAKGHEEKPDNGC